MAARSDLQSSSSSYGLFGLPQSNTMQNSAKSLKNLFVPSTQSAINVEDDAIRNQRSSSDATRNLALLRLDSTGNELGSQMKSEYEKPCKISPFVEGSIAAICGCLNVHIGQFSVLTADVKKDYSTITTCHNYLTRDSDKASLSNLSKFSPTKSGILNGYNRCLKESKVVSSELKANVVKTSTHDHLVASEMNVSTSSDGTQITVILSGLAGNLATDKDNIPSISKKFNIVGDQKMNIITVAPECSNDKDVEVVHLNLGSQLGEELGSPQEKDSNMLLLVEDQKGAHEMDSGNFSECADDWEDVNDDFFDMGSEISEGDLPTVVTSTIEVISDTMKSEGSFIAENQSNNERWELCDPKKEAFTDVSRKHCQGFPCLLRAASQRYIRGLCFMTRQSSIELDKGESGFKKALKHGSRVRGLHEPFTIRRRTESDKKEHSVVRLKKNNIVESCDSTDEGCYESEDHSDIKTPEKMHITVENSKQTQLLQCIPPSVVYRSQFYCPLSLSDSSSEEDSSPENYSSDDEDASFNGSSTTVSSFAPTAMSFMTNFFGNGCSLFQWQKEDVQCLTETPEPSGKKVKTCKRDTERLLDRDDADKIAAEQSLKRIALVNENWSKMCASSASVQINTTLSTSGTDSTICTGQVGRVRVCKKVHFCTAGDNYIPILNEIGWADEYASARVGPWVQMGLDRNRFQRRIAEVEAVVSQVLTPEHRRKVLLRLE